MTVLYSRGLDLKYRTTKLGLKRSLRSFSRDANPDENHEMSLTQCPDLAVDDYFVFKLLKIAVTH